jgi:UDPglucose--hexose-1-phosphate uridylyltransferase
MPELRKNPLLGQWIAVASERVARIDQFISPAVPLPAAPCRFCPGREHELPPPLVTIDAVHPANDTEWSLRVVPSKFPMLRVEGSLGRRVRGVYDQMHGIGAHEIIIPTPRHGLDFGDLPVAAVAQAITTWVGRITDLERDTRFRSFVVAHTRGAPNAPDHAHTQLMATPIIPQHLHAEWLQARAYHDYRDRCLCCDLLEQERTEASRIIYEGEHIVALCPFASARPFEVWLLPRRHAARLPAITPAECDDLAQALQSLTHRIDAVLGRPPFSLTVHQAPCGEDGNPACHWHLELVPRLAFPGPAALETGIPINPVAPEDAAAFLRARP